MEVSVLFQIPFIYYLMHSYTGLCSSFSNEVGKNIRLSKHKNQRVGKLVTYTISLHTSSQASGHSFIKPLNTRYRKYKVDIACFGRYCYPNYYQCTFTGQYFKILQQLSKVAAEACHKWVS